MYTWLVNDWLASSKNRTEQVIGAAHTDATMLGWTFGFLQCVIAVWALKRTEVDRMSRDELSAALAERGIECASCVSREDYHMALINAIENDTERAHGSQSEPTMDEEAINELIKTMFESFGNEDGELVQQIVNKFRSGLTEDNSETFVHPIIETDRMADRPIEPVDSVHSKHTRAEENLVKTDNETPQEKTSSFSEMIAGIVDHILPDGIVKDTLFKIGDSVVSLWRPAKNSAFRKGAIILREGRRVALVAMTEVRKHTAIAVRKTHAVALPHFEALTKYVLDKFRALYNRT